MSVSRHLDEIETAFRQLSFAIRVNNYLGGFSPSSEEEVKDIFNEEMPIDESDGSGPLPNLLTLPANEWKTYGDIQIAAENNILIWVSAVAVTLWEAIKEKTGKESRALNPVNNTDSDDTLAALAYAIRCCFAHGSVEPRWCLQDSKYRIVYNVGRKKIDLTKVHDTVFNFSSIQGYSTLWMIKNEAQSKGIL